MFLIARGRKNSFEVHPTTRGLNHRYFKTHAFALTPTVVTLPIDCIREVNGRTTLEWTRRNHQQLELEFNRAPNILIDPFRFTTRIRGQLLVEDGTDHRGASWGPARFRHQS